MKGKPVITPVYLSATYKFKHSDDLIDVVTKHEGYLYSRWDNPSTVEAEKYLAALEGYDKALGFSSGMAAITTSIMANCKAGTKIVAIRELYGATFEFLHDVLPHYGIKSVFINCWKIDQILDEIANGTAILYLESPTNPLLRLVDIRLLAKAAHKYKAIVICDSTFASPINQHPRDLDVDITIHSATKYLGGHHDITAGFICCHQPYFDDLWNYRKIFGGIMDPMTAFLAQRGMQTLGLRIKQQNESAMAIAFNLDQHDKIKTVYYPGLSSHPDHAIARKQMSGFGGMLSFEIEGDFSQTKRFMDHLKTIKLATSLGGVTTLANQPITNTHVALSPENRAQAGISESLVRLSVGIEPVTSLLEDIHQALDVL